MHWRRAWLVGWSLILEYTIGGAAVAHGITPNLALFFGGREKLPAFLVRHTIPELGGVVIDPCAAILVIIVTALLCLGIKEVMNPQRDLPLGIGIALSVCCILYMLVSVVIVGLVPYYALDPDTPISSIFCSKISLRYIITTGAVIALFAEFIRFNSSSVFQTSSLCLCAQILMAMVRDGLLWSSFSDINEHTRVPVKGTVASGVCATVLAFFMDVSQLAGMVSVGTVLAFTSVAVSVLVIRYVPPNKVPLSPSLQESLSLPFGGNIQESEIQISKGRSESGENENPGLHEEEEASLGRSLI